MIDGIEVKRDPTLKQSEVIVRLDSASPEQLDGEYEKNPSDVKQTSIYGIHCPIIAVNNVVVAFEDILDFHLSDSGVVPNVSMVINDRKDLIKILQSPSDDNELRIQILPPFDDIYKKIDLTFFISSYNVRPSGALSINGIYKLPKFTNSQFKSMGEISLYNLFDTISAECEIGFATNVEDADDKRFVYCDYTSYENVLNEEVNHSGDQTTVYSWWIDPWNYLNLINMYERFYAIDDLDSKDAQIYISGQLLDISESIDTEPLQVKPEFTNIIGTEGSQLFVKYYKSFKNPGVNLSGNDKVRTIYNMNSREYEDIYLYDENGAKKDIFQNFEYLGEVYGDYNYLISNMYREPLFQKMNMNTINMCLGSPVLGLHRGMRINFAWYYNDDSVDYIKDGLIENGAAKEPETTVPMTEIGQIGESDTFKLDKTISGQYLIKEINYIYRGGEWSVIYSLVRPPEQEPKIIDTEDDAII